MQACVNIKDGIRRLKYQTLDFSLEKSISAPSFQMGSLMIDTLLTITLSINVNV